MLQQQSIIVPQISSYPDPEGRARKVLRWLSQQRIVEPQLSTCVAGGNGMGYALAEGARQVLELQEQDLRLTHEEALTLLQHLQVITDPRLERTRRHELQSILAIALCATIAGADNWVEVAEFGELHHDWFVRFIPLPSGIASHDTFARVFRLLDAKQLELACQQWLAQVAGRVHGTVAIDGKSVRGSSKGDARRPLHMVSAWAADMGLLLGQCKVDGKSNEITAIPELLRLIHLKGCIVTIDAIGCQKTIAQQLHEHGADYVLSLKGNQRHMHEVVQTHFEVPCTAGQQGDNTYAEHSSGHGREELRSYRVSPVPEALQRAAVHWPGLASVVQVTRQRQQESLSSNLYTDCPYCRGRGIVKSATTVSVELQRKLNAGAIGG